MDTCRRSIISAAITVGFALACVAALNAQEQSGTIVFFREPHFAAGHFKPAVLCDGIEIARIENGTYFQITAPAGLHTCTAELSQRPLIEVNVLPGQAAYVHVEIQPGFKEHAILANTTETEYNKQKAKLIPLKEWSRDTLRAAQPPASTDSAESPSPALAKQPDGKAKDRHSGKFGDLAVSVTKLTITPAQYVKDRNEVEAFVHVANTGKGVLCADLSARLNTTFGLQYGGASARAPRIHEMLPGESSEGTYTFDIKDGVEPVELLFRLGGWMAGSKIRCGSNLPPFRDVLVPDEIRLDVRDLLITDVQPSSGDR